MPVILDTVIQETRVACAVTYYPDLLNITGRSKRDL